MPENSPHRVIVAGKWWPDDEELEDILAGIEEWLDKNVDGPWFLEHETDPGHGITITWDAESADEEDRAALQVDLLKIQARWGRT